MEPSRFLLEGSSLQELKARILAEHGADARIVAAERVTIGGIKGFFARRHIEVTVEVPARLRRAAHSRLDVQARLGIAALLEEADAAEAGLHPAAAPRTPAAAPRLSTASDGFAHLMDALTFATQDTPAPVLLTPVPTTTAPITTAAIIAAAPAAVSDSPAAEPAATALHAADRGAARWAPDRSPDRAADRATDRAQPAGAAPARDPGRAPAQRGGRRRDARLRETELAAARAAVPRPLSGIGDLVLVVGWQDAALRVAQDLAAAHGSAEVLVAGTIDATTPAAATFERVLDRRTALEARARGVELGQTGFLAFGLGADPATAHIHAALLAALGADQVWLVVDAGRKPADTARWAAEVARSVQIDAIAVTGYGTTGSPESVDDLQLPIGWVDGASAAASTAAEMRLVLAARTDRSG